MHSSRFFLLDAVMTTLSLASYLSLSFFFRLNRDIMEEENDRLCWMTSIKEQGGKYSPCASFETT